MQLLGSLSDKIRMRTLSLIVPVSAVFAYLYARSLKCLHYLCKTLKTRFEKEPELHKSSHQLHKDKCEHQNQDYEQKIEYQVETSVVSEIHDVRQSALLCLQHS